MNQIEDLPWFYEASAVAGSSVELNPEDSKHCKVLRLQSGDRVHVSNGQGKLFEGIIDVQKRSASVSNLALIQEEKENPNSLILAVAPTKNMARLEWVIEKATEVGVKTIVPIECEHSERVHLKLDRLQRIMISAVKQSNALWNTEILDMIHFSELLKMPADQKFIAHCKDDFEKTSMKQLLEKVPSRIIAIGPEGDFSFNEINEALNNGFSSLSLGTKRLRTETAAIAACIASEAF